jgi:hypothetical protein
MSSLTVGAHVKCKTYQRIWLKLSIAFSVHELTYSGGSFTVVLLKNLTIAEALCTALSSEHFTV